MDNEINYSPEWYSKAGIELTNSMKAYEEYGNYRLINITFGFVVGRKYEFIQDIILSRNGISEELKEFLDFVEQLYVFSRCRVNDDYGTYLLSKAIKPEGLKGNDILDWYNRFNALKRDSNYSMGYLSNILKETTPKDCAPVFQRRMNWLISYGDFCERCGKEGSFTDYSAKVYSRFAFGFVETKHLLTRKRILFRKFK